MSAIINPLNAGNGKYYVYIHHRMGDGSVFYVGKGTGKRAWLRAGRSDVWFDNCNGDRLVVILADGLSSEAALFVERVVIDLIGLSNLANKTYGGGGSEGYRHSETWKSILSSKMSGLGNPMYGRTKEKNGFYGMKHSDATREKMSGKRPSVSGNNNPSADKSIYTFVHDSGDVYTGNRFDFSVDRLLRLEGIGKIVRNCAKYRGWRVLDGK